MPQFPKLPHKWAHRGLLPEGKYYILTWGIAATFGGMTTALLARSSAFARFDNRRIEILTLDPKLKTPERDKELHDKGQLHPKVSIRNIWRDLTSWSDRKLQHLVPQTTMLADIQVDPIPRTGDGWCQYRYANDGTILQVDRYRDSGELLITDQLDTRERGKRGGRLLTLFDGKQNVIGQWTSARDFYFAWLDVLFADDRVYLISDSPVTGSMISNYRKDNVIVSQIMHSAFRNTSPLNADEIAKDKFQIVTHIDSYDFLACLTDRQRTEMESADLSAGKMYTISNMTDDMHGDATAARNPRVGMLVSQLIKRKRIDHAVNAIAKVLPENPHIHLDVYGEGDQAQDLQQLIEDLQVESSVTLRGYVPGAKEHFHEASFSILSSCSEGQGLVLLESMSAGCIPISYDIEYGPSDIITDGVNGFLVPAGDFDALAKAILRVTTMKQDELTAMRRAAIKRAEDFYPRHIVARWGEVFAQQSFGPSQPLQELTATLISADVNSDSSLVRVKVAASQALENARVFLSWQTRKGSYFGRVEGSLKGDVLEVTVSTPRLASVVPQGLIDVSVDIVLGRHFNRVRIAGSKDVINNQAGDFNLYMTAHGNLSGRITCKQPDAEIS